MDLGFRYPLIIAKSQKIRRERTDRGEYVCLITEDHVRIRKGKLD